MYIFGIDPGFGGAVALYRPSDNFLTVADMPINTDGKGRKLIDMHALSDLLEPPPNTAVRAAVEYVASRPGQSAPAMFRFGQGYGALQMALAVHKIPVQYPTPSKWKKYFNLSNDKGVSRSLAQERFPNNASDFRLVKHDGRAEAALIALYGAEKLFNI